MLAGGIARLADFLLPPQCAACGARISAAGNLCGSCWGRLRFIEAPYCQRLGIPLAFDCGPGAVSPRAIAAPPVFSRARAAVLYDDVARQLVHGLKYRDRHDLTALMARMMVRAGSELLGEATLVAPVPLHRRRLWTRRFNQSALLAKEISRLSGVPLVPDLLSRIKATRQQVGLSAEQRRRNVAGAFRLDDDWRARISGQRVVLVDDVLTTGATVEGCARVLLRSGAGRVDVLLFALVAQPVENPI
ncbi:MAG TPA: ComF family protein [Hyphomicrobiales bacterium]|nr:ComF family protein [Rhodobiaceae bacterium]HXK54002.1 ComF family protein [Hyphomicrobiales bacterium]